ncbi:TPA: glycosyltransferase family 2 protein [Candidatus Poribacteria bacterium]|nr:glycosyltransferase family 2 protein [Candidatus Poribacteria bacterium]
MFDKEVPQRLVTMKICLLLPAYNEAKTIGCIIKKARAYIESIIVIDDGSTDETVQVAREHGVVVLQHKINCGKGMALRTGFKYALEHNYDIIITMDSDGQHEPADIPRFLAHLGQNDADILIGARVLEREKMPLHRRLNNKLISRVGSLLCGQNVVDFQCGFRLFKGEVLRSITLETVRYETESELLIKAGRLGFRIGTLPIKTIYNGEISNVKPLREIYLFTRMFLKNLKDL